MPWTFFVIAPLKQAWRRLKENSLEPRHALLLGWIVIPLLVLSCSGSKLLTYVLPLLPAFAIILGVSLQSTRRVWTVALTSATCWLTVAACADQFSPMLERQASIRTLAQLLKEDPEAEDAHLFTCGVRAHSFAFYMNDLVATTKGDADIVLPLDLADKARVYKSVTHCARTLSNGHRAYGIVDRERYENVFKPRGWTSMGDEGDFVLITNEHVPALVLAR